MERINVEEVYGEPIDEDDTIFKLSNSGKRVDMYCVNDLILDYYKLYESLGEEFVDIYELATRINNDRHEGKLNKEWIENKMIEMDRLSIKNTLMNYGGDYLYDN